MGTIFLVIIKINFKIFSSISSEEIPPRSACKCLQNLYKSVAIHMKYVLLVLLLSLPMYLGLQYAKRFDHAPKQSFTYIFETPYLYNLQAHSGIARLPGQPLENRRQP